MTEFLSSEQEGEPAPKILTPEARRALDEAEARRKAIDEKAEVIARQKEINGRGGHEPTRYNDWEIKGLTSDF